MNILTAEKQLIKFNKQSETIKKKLLKCIIPTVEDRQRKDIAQVMNKKIKLVYEVHFSEEMNFSKKVHDELIAKGFTVNIDDNYGYYRIVIATEQKYLAPYLDTTRYWNN